MRLRFLTAGESHGQALVGILEGMPAGVPLSLTALASQMRRRKHGFGRGARQAIETDAFELVAGVRHGQTLGSPIAIVLPNLDWANWRDVMQVTAPSTPAEREAVQRRRVDVPRPGHADRIGGLKYQHDDLRNVLERASARETAMRVALGSLARALLASLDITVGSRVVAIGEVVDDAPCTLAGEAMGQVADASLVRCVSVPTSAHMVEAIDEARQAGDTLGGIFELNAEGLPPGLGSYAQWDRRLEAAIGQSLLSLNAIKSVEVGMGWHAGARRGSQLHDSPVPSAAGTAPAYASNRSGGIDGGMSTGQPLWVRAAMKPLATLMTPLASVHVPTGEAAQAHTERSDVCAVPSAAVVAESLLALVLADAVLDKFGGDSLKELAARVRDWRTLRTG